MLSNLQKIPWKGLKSIVRFKLYQEIVHPTGLEIVAGQPANQEAFTETLDYAAINLDQELTTENCQE